MRSTAEDDPNLVVIPGLPPLVNKETGEITYVAAHVHAVHAAADNRLSVRESNYQSGLKR